MKKYEINSENRVVALIDFSNIKTGDIGGFVESEENLSHDGLCWVSGNARVSGNAQVREGLIMVKGRVVTQIGDQFFFKPIKTKIRGCGITRKIKGRRQYK